MRFNKPYISPYLHNPFHAPLHKITKHALEHVAEETQTGIERARKQLKELRDTGKSYDLKSAHTRIEIAEFKYHEALEEYFSATQEQANVEQHTINVQNTHNQRSRAYALRTYIREREKREKRIRYDKEQPHRKYIENNTDISRWAKNRLVLAKQLDRPVPIHTYGTLAVEYESDQDEIRRRQELELTHLKTHQPQTTISGYIDYLVRLEAAQYSLEQYGELTEEVIQNVQQVIPSAEVDTQIIELYGWVSAPKKWYNHGIILTLERRVQKRAQRSLITEILQRYGDQLQQEEMYPPPNILERIVGNE